MEKKQTKTLKGLQLNIFQKTNTQINMTIKNPHAGKEFQWSSVEHTDKHHGKNKARTHNNLFTYFKDVLAENDLWKDLEEPVSDPSTINSIDIDNKYGYVYMTKNLTNNMRYIGKQTCSEDDELGKGPITKKVIEEAGKENFTKEILAYAYSSEQLTVLEKTYIETFRAIEDELFYN